MQFIDAADRVCTVQRFRRLALTWCCVPEWTTGVGQAVLGSPEEKLEWRKPCAPSKPSSFGQPTSLHRTFPPPPPSATASRPQPRPKLHLRRRHDIFISFCHPPRSRASSGTCSIRVARPRKSWPALLTRHLHRRLLECFTPHTAPAGDEAEVSVAAASCRRLRASGPPPGVSLPGR